MNGLLLFNKPILWTSHDAVDFVRRRVGQKKVGHAGTLDPLATGLLLMLLGDSTKRCEALSGLEKEYSGTFMLGMSTDTQDLEGRFLSSAASDFVKESQLAETFLTFKGPQWQIPPSFSAARKDGKRLYDLARRGIAVDVKPKPVTVSRFDLLYFNPPEAAFSLVCSKGTYVRSICDSVGRALGCGAVLSALVRSRVGAFHLKNALNAEDLRDMSSYEIEKRLLR